MLRQVDSGEGSPAGRESKMDGRNHVCDAELLGGRAGYNRRTSNW